LKLEFKIPGIARKRREKILKLKLFQNIMWIDEREHF